MKVHVLSDSTVCVVISNPDPSNMWTTKLDELRHEHGFHKNENLAAREMRFIRHVHPGALSGWDHNVVDVQRHSLEKERQYRHLFAQRQRSGNTCGKIHASTLVTPVCPGVCVRKDVVERKSQQFSWTMGQTVDIFKCHTSHPIFPATAPFSLGQLNK